MLVAVVVALIAHHVVAGTVVDRLKARVNNAPKAPKKIDPKDPNFDLDEALPVHADYHAGGWTVTNLDDKLVDRAARKIIREIKPAKKDEDKPKKGENKYALTPEEHAALKKLLADADVLVKRASKVAGADAADVAASAVKNAKKIQKPAAAGKAGGKVPAAAGKEPGKTTPAAAAPAKTTPPPAPAAAAKDPAPKPAAAKAAPAPAAPAAGAAAPAPAKTA